MEFNGTFLVSAVSFVVFVFIMNAVLYAPLQKVVDERKKFIDDNYDEAKANADKSTALIKDRADKLLKASSDAKAKMNEMTEVANLKRDEMAAQAKADAQKNIDANREYFSNASGEAKDVLKKEVVKLAQSISDKFLNSDEKIVDVDNDLIDNIMQR